MAPNSPKRDLAEQAESPIVPPQDTDPVTINEVQPTTLDAMAIDYPSQQQSSAHRAQVRTPEPQLSHDRAGGHREIAETSPSTPGHLPPFDWDEFESRYEQALAEANLEEQQLLEEFDQLVRVSKCNPHGKPSTCLAVLV